MKGKGETDLITKELQGQKAGAAIYSRACSELLEAIHKKKNSYNIPNILAKQLTEKPRRQHYVVTAMELIKKAARECGHEIRRRDGLRFYYNGKKWEQLTDDRFNSFLSNAALLMRVPEEEARFIDTIDKLRRSYDVNDNWPVPQLPRGEARLNCNNGTLEITETGEVNFRDHQANDGMLYVLPYDYDPEATAPMFEQFLQEVCPEQADRDNLQEYCGYLFAPSLKLQKFLYLCGHTGNNGKSVFVEIIKNMCGLENVSLASLDTLCENSSNGDSARLELEGKVLNVCTETPRKIKNAELFKTITIGEAVSARLMHTNTIRKIENPARLMFAGNDLPVFENGAGTAEQRRFLIVEFAVQIAKEKRDSKLAEKIIEAELPGVLNWAIKGLQRLNTQKDFTKNLNGERMAEAFLDASNNVMAYLHDNGLCAETDAVLKAPDTEKFTPGVSEIYGSFDNLYGTFEELPTYLSWCRDEGRKPVGRKEFVNRAAGAGIKTKRIGKGYIMLMRRRRYE